MTSVHEGIKQFKCQCVYCVEMRKFFEIVAKLSEDDQRWMENFYSQVEGDRLDANVNEAVLDGSWPSAIEQLEHSLRKAKQKREDQEASDWFEQECKLWQL